MPSSSALLSPPLLSPQLRAPQGERRHSQHGHTQRHHPQHRLALPRAAQRFEILRWYGHHAYGLRAATRCAYGSGGNDGTAYAGVNPWRAQHGSGCPWQRAWKLLQTEVAATPVPTIHDLQPAQSFQVPQKPRL